MEVEEYDDDYRQSSSGLTQGYEQNYYYSYFSYGEYNPSQWFGYEQASQNAQTSFSDYPSGAPDYEDDDTSGWSGYNSSEWSYPATLSLYPSGCLLDDGSHDCPRACADPARVWSGQNWTYTLANCMIYPLIALALGKGVLQGNQSFSLATRYGIEADADLDLSDAWATINDCTSAYCATLGNSQADCAPFAKPEHAGMLAKWNLSGWHPELRFNTTLCNGVDPSVNQDLGGVGMITAYIIQLSILLAGWLISCINGRAAGLLAFPYFWARGRKEPLRGCWEQAKTFQGHVRQSSQAVALKVALVEFHKTQTFFVLAVSVAALLAVNDAAYFHVSSWQQLWNNFGFITTVAFGGCYPVILNMLILRQTQRLSLFLLATSACCVAVSMALWIRVISHQPDRPDPKLFMGVEGFEECAGTNPTISCLQTERQYIAGFNASNRALAFPLVVLLFLVGEEARVFPVDSGTGTQSRENVFHYLKHRMSVLDLRLAWQTLGRLSLMAWTTLERRSQSLLLHNQQQTRMTSLRMWYKKSVWWIQDQLSRFANRFPATRVFYAAFMVPAGAWLYGISIRAWRAMCDLDFRQIYLWCLDALYRLVPFLTEIGMVAINGLLLAQYATYLGQLTDNSWSLGQIISVTIWVPILVEYIYLLFCGIEEGFEYRLSEPYHIQRREGQGQELKYLAVQAKAKTADDDE